MWRVGGEQAAFVLGCLTVCLALGSAAGQAPRDGEHATTQVVGDDLKKPNIYSLHITSDITFRFATTHVTSRLANHESSPKEASFNMVLPKSAFITNFSMTIDGRVYDGEVKERLAAKHQYEKARSKGQSAGRVSKQTVRNSNVFRVSVTVAARSKVDFNLTYQELLHRRLGRYEHVINVNPGQVVRDIKITVNIRESREIVTLKVPPLKQDLLETIDTDAVNADAVVRRTGPTSAVITYQPSEATQGNQTSGTGLVGQFIVQYDVERDLDAGEVQVIDGYFVHFFAPSGLGAVSKNVLFILDKSGSMRGDKVTQLRTAMITILDDLRDGDNFNIVAFSKGLSYWKEEMIQATASNREKAKKFISNISAEGGTNINDAVMRGLEVLKEQRSQEFRPKPSMIIFLTDGEPTSGITSLSQILTNIRKSNLGQFTLYSLGFGSDVDFPFLQKISLQNRGLARRIYHDSDAALQLAGFYNEVSTPVMSDVSVQYVGDVVEANSTSKLDFPAFYRGSEIVVVGKLKDGIKNFDLKVSGNAASSYLSLDSEVRVAKVERDALRTAESHFTERLWAHLTIQKLMDDMVESSVPREREEAKARALQLSLKYSFVTPLTSMVVTKPDEPAKNLGDLADSDQVADESASRDSRQRFGHSGSPQSSPGGASLNTRGSTGGGGGRTFVDNDPHFIISVRGLKEAICYDLMGEPGQVYQLIHDKVTGIVVNGVIVGQNSSEALPPGTHRQTYLGEITVIRNSSTIHLAPHKITVNNRTVYQWRKSLSFTMRGGATVEIEAKKSVKIVYPDEIAFVILCHIVRPHHPKGKVDYLGVYINEPSKLSEHTHGLIGQFVHQTGRIIGERKVNDVTATGKGAAEGVVSLRFRGPHVSHRTVPAKLIRRRDMVAGFRVPCWNIKRYNGHGLIVGRYTDYIIPSLFHTQFALDHYKAARKLPVFDNARRGLT